MALDLDPGEIERRELLGCGGFGAVYRAIWRGQEVACKEFRDPELCADLIAMEIRILERLVHPRLVRFIGACRPTRDHACLIMEYMSGGSLHDLLYMYSGGAEAAAGAEGPPSENRAARRRRAPLSALRAAEQARGGGGGGRKAANHRQRAAARAVGGGGIVGGGIVGGGGKAPRHRRQHAKGSVGGGTAQTARGTQW